LKVTGIKRYYICYSQEEVDEVVNIYERLKTDYERNGGFVFTKFTEGQKEGSIAKLVFDLQPLRLEKRYTWSKRNSNFAVIEGIISTRGVCRWKGRSNKPKGTLGYKGLVWLEGYEGETVWNISSAEEEKIKALEEPVYDMDESVLSIGDKVLYINARYGEGYQLCHGIIDRFEAEYHLQTNTTSTYTIVKNLEHLTEESKISSPRDFIKKGGKIG
jgi:hypothetical protein